MGTLFLSEIKKQASSFLQEKYKSARLILTDVTKTELLTEEATDGDPRSPDPRTMARISEAAFDVDDYWRIIDVLHQRLYIDDWKQWRSKYKALVLIDFLLTHGPEKVADDFQSDLLIIQELANFKHVDEQGFNWGAAMKKKSERILKLLKEEGILQEARTNALKVSKEIQGFGNLIASPYSPSSRTSRTSFGSCSSSSPRSWNDPDEQLYSNEPQSPTKNSSKNSPRGSMGKSATLFSNRKTATHLWDTPDQENGLLLDSLGKSDEKEGHSRGYTKLTSPRSRDDGNVGFGSFLNVGIVRRKIDRQFSMGI